MAMTDDCADLLEAVDRGDDPLAELRMRLHDRALVRGEPAGLREDLARDPDLPDVVQERAELEPLQRAVVEADLAADTERKVSNPAGVRRRVLVVRLECVRERLHRRDKAALESLVVRRVRDGEARLMRETAEEPELALAEIALEQ